MHGNGGVNRLTANSGNNLLNGGDRIVDFAGNGAAAGNLRT